MNRAVLFLCVVVLAILGGGVAIAISQEDPKPVAFCEADLKKSLLAPSTYKRIDYTIKSTPYDWDEGKYRELLNRIGSDSELVRIGAYSLDKKEHLIEGQFGIDREALRGGFSFYVVRIEFDVMNTMGVPLRKKAHCRWIREGKDDRSFAWDEGMRLSTLARIEG